MTYNVSGAVPAPSPTALTFLQDPVLRKADMLVIGLQEVDVSSSAYIRANGVKTRAWTNAIYLGLKASETSSEGEDSDGRQWELVMTQQHVTIMLLIYQRTTPNQDLTTESPPATPPFTIDRLRDASVGVGFGGFMANKGAVSCRFRLSISGPEPCEMTLCFLVAHLSAGTGRIARERRVWDWTEIQRRLQYELPIESDRPPARGKTIDQRKSETSSDTSSDTSSEYEYLTMMDHEYVAARR